MHEGQKSFHSKAAYVNLVAVLIITALIIVSWKSGVAAAVFAGLGLIWTALTLRSGIEVTDDGFTVRGMLRTRHLTWSDVDAFIVVGFDGTNRPVLRTALDYVAPATDTRHVVGVSMGAITTEAVTDRVGMFSVVGVVNQHGERFRVHGTASTPLNSAYPAHAAAELNRTLKRHSPTATGS